MAFEGDERRQAYLDKLRAEFEQLTEYGLVSGGNALSSLMVIKGDLSEAERAGAELLSGRDGEALRAAFHRLGYAPEDLVTISAFTREAVPVAPELLRQALSVLSPLTVVVCDDTAARILCEAYPEQLHTDGHSSCALVPGHVVLLLGMRVINLGGFEDSLEHEDTKQRSWRYLKQVPQLSQPY